MWGSFGLAISMMLIAVLLSFTTARGYSQQLNKATSSASVAFFFTYVSPPTPSNIWTGRLKVFRCSFSVRRQIVFHGKIILSSWWSVVAKNWRVQGLCPWDSAPSCKSKGHSNWHFFKLALGNLMSYRCRIIIADQKNRTSLWSWSLQLWSTTCSGKPTWYSCARIWHLCL